MSKMFGLKKKQKEPFPIIEMMGPIDIGKTNVSMLVAKRLKGNFLSLPVLDPYTSTGRALLAALSNSPRALEKKPEWWAHIYIANVYEQADRIESLRMIGPVVINNYLLSYRSWMRATGMNMAVWLKGFTVNLTEPLAAYSVVGHDPLPTSGPKFDFSPEFILSIKRSMNLMADKRVTKVDMGEINYKAIHVTVNNTAIAITNDLRDRYKLKVDETQLLTKDAYI